MSGTGLIFLLTVRAIFSDQNQLFRWCLFCSFLCCFIPRCNIQEPNTNSEQKQPALGHLKFCYHN